METVARCNDIVPGTRIDWAVLRPNSNSLVSRHASPLILPCVALLPLSSGLDSHFCIDGSAGVRCRGVSLTPL